MQNHTEVLNYIIKAKGYSRYLELGCQSGKNFNSIKIDNWVLYFSSKHSVDNDPASAAMYVMTTDEYLDGCPRVYDLIFIDADHTAEQVKKDFIGAWSILSEEGIIVLHDTNPDRKEIATKERKTKEWCGTVWQFVSMLGADFVTLPFDYGITVVKKKGGYTLCANKPEEFEWEGFDRYREKTLKLVTEDEFKQWL